MATTSVTSEIRVVQDFLAALGRLDAETSSAFLHPEAVYQNVPLPPARGAEAVERQLRGFERILSGFEVHTHNIAADGPIVLTERTDVLIRGRLRAEIWVCGTFEVRDGRVVLWRDYFDYANVTWALLKGGVRALLGR